MSTLVQWILRQNVRGVAMESVFNFRVDTPPSVTALTNFAGEMDDAFLDAINAVQDVSTVNVSWEARRRGAGAFSLSGVLGGTGTYDPGIATRMPPENAFWVHEYVGESKLWSNDTPVTVRPINRGGIFLPGITDDYFTDNQFIIPEAQEGAWSALYGVLTNPVVVGGSTNYNHVVWGRALPTTPTRPVARPECYADVEGAQVLRATRLRSRLT